MSESNLEPSEQAPSEQMPAQSEATPEAIPERMQKPEAQEMHIEPADEEKIAAVRQEINQSAVQEQPQGGQGEQVKLNIEGDEPSQVPPQEKKSFWESLFGG